MSMVSPLVESSPVSYLRRAFSAVERYFTLLADITKPETSWDTTTYLALFSLVLLWAFRMCTTWATWGNLSIDSGHEAYVPAALAHGKMLYRDVWWMYTPLAPYINAFLFQAFGIHLEVLYWAGSLSALGSALLLFLIGKRLSSRLIGWTAAAILLLQAFHAWHFCFPLPYSFAPVYGCLTACLFLWCGVNAAFSNHRGWIFGAACCAAIALLLKMEFGVACYLAFCAIIAMSALLQRSWRVVLTGLLAILPGLIACAFVFHWMISIAGASFITQENIMSWPTAYFMKTYGKIWLEKTGFSLSPHAFGQAALRTIFFAGFVFEAVLIGWWKRTDVKSIVLRTALAVALLAYGLAFRWDALGLLGGIFFPRDMVLYVCAAAALASWFFLKHSSAPSAAIATLLVFSGLLASRLLLKMAPGGYPIYYNGPVILAFLLLLRPIIPREGRPQRMIFQGELLLALGCLATVAIASVRLAADRSDLVELKSDRGSILVPTQVAANYQAAIQFIKEKNSRGEVVLSVPEDTSLYFLSGQDCPTRIFLFGPGVVAPGKMTDEVIGQIEKKQVRYLIWSNRTYPDYGTPVFGVDFDQILGNYLTTHYSVVGPLVPRSDLDWETRFTVWERNPDTGRTHLVTPDSR